MPSGEEIQSYLIASWRLMSGRPDAIQAFDLSADGFWNSFFAILVAVPALTVGWVTVAGDAVAVGGAPGRLSMVVLLAVVEIAAWVLPLVGLAFLARPLGIHDRFVHYVVASNWGSALLVWLTLPPALLRLVAPGLDDLGMLLSLGFFLASLVLTWRLTNAVINRGPGPATAVFATMVFMSFAVFLSLQSLFGIELPAAG